MSEKDTIESRAAEEAAEAKTKAKKRNSHKAEEAPGAGGPGASRKAEGGKA